MTASNLAKKEMKKTDATYTGNRRGLKAVRREKVEQSGTLMSHVTFSKMKQNQRMAGKKSFTHKLIEHFGKKNLSLKGTQKP